MQGSIDVTTSRKARVLAEAVLNAGTKLGLTAGEVGQIVGRDRTSISRNGVHPNSKSGELALILVSIYRGLYALVGGREGEIAHWMHSPIRTLQGAPADMIKSVTGLVRVAEYIDAIRAKG